MTYKITVELVEENGEYKVKTNMMDYLPKGDIISSDTLGMAFEPEERFEEPNGDDIILDTDYYGKKRSDKPVFGPFA